MAKMLTQEGATQYDHSLDNYVEFFSKAGSLFDTPTKKSFYGNETTALELFKLVWASGDNVIAMKLLFWLRDRVGGAGNRSGFRACLNWLANTSHTWIDSNIELIPELGRWDDLRTLFGTVNEVSAVKIWTDAIVSGNGLACKWADRTDKPLYKELRVRKIVKDIGEFRRLLANGRKSIVERKMCKSEWNAIEYPTVPSVAMSRYTKAFKKHDSDRFESFKTKVKSGEATINASVLFPHDCIRTASGGDKDIADLQFAALPDYMDNKTNRILCLADTSWSMNKIIGGSISAMDVSMALSLYCSDRIGKDNPFYRKFIEFKTESKLTDWSDIKFSDTVNMFNGAVGTTRIDIALNTILTFGTMFKVTNDKMPTHLLIISDMQFSEGVSTTDNTIVEHSIAKWVTAGYDAPKIIYWNTAGSAGSPATVQSKNVALVSGFSTAILKSIFSCEDFSPRSIMMNAIDKYKIIIPQ